VKSKTIVPIDRERVLAPGEYIISTADLSGRITSVNDVLVEFSGYSRDELLNAQHNIIRHPEMPRTVFWLAWDALQSGEDFSAYIRNMSKDGSFYWVFAHILPEHDAAGNISGYRSVRRCPRRTAVTTLSELYAEMLAAERAVAAKDAIEAGLTILRRHLSASGTSYERMIAGL